MGDRKIQIVGHQRSGNHYFAALVEKNLFGGKDYVRHMNSAGHLYPEQVSPEKKPNVLFICTYRNFEDTLKSIFAMRKRFGLVGTLEDFRSKKIEELYKPKGIKGNVEINWYFRDKTTDNGVSGYFGSPPVKKKRLVGWHNDYIRRWKAAADDATDRWKNTGAARNVMLVSYDHIIADPDYKTICIALIAHFVGVEFNVAEFEDITERVGYYDRGDKGWPRS